MVTKIEQYRETLRTLSDWRPFLRQASGLPGPRGNLELAQAVAEEGSKALFLQLLADDDPERTPGNSPEMFLAFCGVVGLGTVLAQGEREMLPLLRRYANDPRWRIREAVAMALQRWGDVDMAGLLEEMARWAEGSLLEQRAAVAALCEPRLLREAGEVERVLQLLDLITAALQQVENRKSEEFKALRKGLGYGWSVAVAALPEAGKRHMERWFSSSDPDIQWIMRENLKKDRLKRMDAAWVAEQGEGDANDRGRMTKDYVVIGAGSAGCVVANRLTEDPDVTVLLLEAGGPDTKPEIQIPFALTRLLQSEVDWAYYTEPQPHLNGRRIFWPRGKVLGGTSSINAMVYMRGHPRIYDEWQAMGNEGWSYAEVLPYFKKSEHQERGADAYHGADGPLNVADPRDPNPLSCAFVEAIKEVGLPLNNDFNGAEQEGFGFFQLTMKNGQRWSTASAFLKPALDRPNLTVIPFAHATRLLFEGRQVVGVAYVQDGQLFEVRADREVVLCGGAINSPQLLLLSGIGPAAALEALDIPVIVDLPGVGQNLQDHLDIPVAYECTEPISLSVSYAAAELLYRYFRKGPLACNGGEVGGFLRTQPDLAVPDLQFHFAPGWSVGFGVMRPTGHGFTFWPALLLPESRGYLQLRSANPLEPPLIQPNYLASEADMAVLVRGFELARTLAHTRAFEPFLGPEIKPGAPLQQPEELREYIRNSASTVFHPVGTCKMGLDPLAVVNPQLQVYGVEGLRVADASIMPTIINGNTNAPAIMIGEKAADLIKNVPTKSLQL